MYFKYSSKYKGTKYDQDGMKADAGFVVVSENDGYWYIMSKPTSKQVAEEFLSTLTIPRGEVGKVVSVEDAKNHKKVIGRKYLKMADGGDVSEMKILVVLSERWLFFFLFFWRIKEHHYLYYLN